MGAHNERRPEGRRGMAGKGGEVYGIQRYSSEGESALFSGNAPKPN